MAERAESPTEGQASNGQDGASSVSKPSIVSQVFMCCMSNHILTAVKTWVQVQQKYKYMNVLPFET